MVRAAKSKKGDRHPHAGALRRNAPADARTKPATGAANCYVYVIGSLGKGGHRTYVGWTTDLEQRLARHNEGTGARSTRGRVWFLLYAERYADRRAAMSREWHLKRDRSLRKMIASVLTGR